MRRILPVEAPRFQTAFGRFSSLVVPDAFDAVVSARDHLELLRVGFFNRSTSEQRRDAIAATGGNPDVDDRVQDLALEVARLINQQLDRGEADVLGTSLAMRALFASGSDTHAGRHRNTVRRCALWLEARLESLNGGELASALTALSDLAVRDGGRMGIVVGKHAASLARETITRPDLKGKDHRRLRPSLLSSDVPAASLGDAGRLFRLAPAFGVRPELAFEARRMVLTHLEERLETSEQPSSLAAQLYGFGDLVRRSELDRRLKPWRPVNQIGNYILRPTDAPRDDETRSGAQ